MNGDAIRDARKAAGYSQDEYAERLGVSRQSLSMWETEKSMPNGDNTIALIIDLKIPPDALDDRSRDKKERYE